MRYDDSGWFGGGTNNVIQLGLQTTAGNVHYESAANVQTTSWQHLVMTWHSGEAIKLYIDGVLDTPSYTGGNLGGTVTGITELLLGRSVKLNRRWNGLIDEFRIYNRALDATQVDALYNWSPTLPTPTPTNTPIPPTETNTPPPPTPTNTPTPAPPTPTNTPAAPTVTPTPTNTPTPVVKPLVSLTTLDPIISESANTPAQIRINRSNVINQNLTVSYIITGTASGGDDYTPISNTITLPTGVTSATINITPIDDSLVEGNENRWFKPTNQPQL